MAEHIPSHNIEAHVSGLSERQEIDEPHDSQRGFSQAEQLLIDISRSEQASWNVLRTELSEELKDTEYENLENGDSLLEVFILKYVSDLKADYRKKRGHQFKMGSLNATEETVQQTELLKTGLTHDRDQQIEMGFGKGQLENAQQRAQPRERIERINAALEGIGLVGSK